MNAVDVVKLAYAGSHMWYQGTIGNVTADQANHAPPGVAHPIGELAVHILQCEDGMINMAIQGKPMIWERDGWGDKLGIPLMMNLPPAAARDYKCDAQALQEYAQAVYKNTEEYLNSLTPGDLDGELDLTAMDMGKMKLGEFLMTMLLGNNYAHTGEISAIKGMLGRKGYPF